MCVEVVYQLAHFLQWKSLRIDGEDPATIHVINVCPHRLKRNVCLTVIVDHRSNFINISIPISTLVKSKTSIGNVCWQTNNLSNLLGCFDWRGTGYEVEIEDTSECVVFQVVTTCVVDVNLDTIGVEQDYPMCTILASIVNIDRMSAIEIGASGDAIRVSVPNCSRIVRCVELKWIAVLTKTIEVRVLWQRSSEVEVL